jgi:hypothetical protein
VTVLPIVGDAKRGAIGVTVNTSWTFIELMNCLLGKKNEAGSGTATKHVPAHYTEESLPLYTRYAEFGGDDKPGTLELLDARIDLFFSVFFFILIFSSFFFLPFFFLSFFFLAVGVEIAKVTGLFQVEKMKRKISQLLAVTKNDEDFDIAFVVPAAPVNGMSRLFLSFFLLLFACLLFLSVEPCLRGYYTFFSCFFFLLFCFLLLTAV